MVIPASLEQMDRGWLYLLSSKIFLFKIICNKQYTSCYCVGVISHKWYRINPFVPNALFIYALKTSENHKGIEKERVGKKWVKIIAETSLTNSKLETFRTVCSYLSFLDVLIICSILFWKFKTVPYADICPMFNVFWFRRISLTWTDISFCQGYLNYLA